MNSSATSLPAKIADRPWPGLDVSGAKILVTGFNVSGYAVVDQVLQRGAKVTAVDANDDAATQERAQILRVLGADIRLGKEHPLSLPNYTDGTPFDLVVTSPGWRPDQPLLKAAEAAGIPIWSEIELARRMQPADGPAWLAVTGTNGKTTVVTMLESILRTAGYRAVAVGNVGLPLIEAVLDPMGYDVIAVELSSFQLHWTQNLMAEASAITNIGQDHLDWHGGIEEYALAKGKIYHQTIKAGFYNVNDELTLRQLEEADVQEGCRAIGITLGAPGPSELGLVDEILVDRAFVENRWKQAAEIGTIDALAHLGADGVPPHMLFNALTAAGLARAFGVEPHAVRDGLLAFQLGKHRGTVVAKQQGISWVNDSKATNLDSADAALAGADSIVWIAGGDVKGANLEPLIIKHAKRLKAVVLLGTDPAPFLKPLQAQLPKIPVTWIDPSALKNSEPTHLMQAAVKAASEFAEAGDTVILAPAAASIDQFSSYAQRGDLFAKFAEELADG